MALTASVAGLFIAAGVDVPASAIIVLLLTGTYIAVRLTHRPLARLFIKKP